MIDFIVEKANHFKKWFLHRLHYDYYFIDGIVDFFALFSFKSKAKFGFVLTSFVPLVLFCEVALGTSFHLTGILVVCFLFYSFFAFPCTAAFYMLFVYFAFFWVYSSLLIFVFRFALLGGY